MPMDKRKYPADWKQVRAAILARAEHRCECTGQCGNAHATGRCDAPNGKLIVRDPVDPAVFYGLGDCMMADVGSPPWLAGLASKAVTVVLTVAHLDHDPSHADPARLRAYCQRCHLRYDRAQHAATAHATRRRGKAVGELPGVRS